jgi:glycosyltransferase involved in cell wall biosynthesis
MTSEYEGMSIVLLESAACQLPCVITDVGGNSEIVRNGVHGILVPIRSSEEIAKGMKKIRELSNTKRRILGLNARKRVEEDFSIEGVIERWEALYESVLAG